MKYIIREKYLEQIKPFVNKPIVKILTGMRRVGKSVLLEIISEEMLNEVPASQKIFINFESLEFFNIRDSLLLKEYLEEVLPKNDEKVYFFFDEIQLVKGWETVVNGLNVDRNCDIYITGSNSTMLSNDLSTLLAGRYVNFEIYPFSFKEFIECYKLLELSKEEYFNQYLLIGGMPVLKYFDLGKEPSMKYLMDVYNTVLVKDVLEYNKIRDVDLFNRILLYAIENIGNTFSALSIKNFFKSEGRNVSVDTVLDYLQYCQKAYLLHQIRRYDFIGKKILKVEEKYYVNDHGFREAKGFSNTSNIERVLENIVYMHLKQNGYEVMVGKVGDKEIDFIAKKGKEIKYFQVCYLLSSEQTKQREFEIFTQINDNYPKFVLSLDTIDFSQNGIQHKNIIEWLLEQ